jgi:hypothetical protein
MNMKQKKYYSTTPLSELSTSELRKVLNFSLRYCVKTFGVNGRKKKDLSVHIKSYSPTSYGEYDPKENEIYLYSDTCRTVGRLCSTLIHEYTHFLQPVLTKYSSAHKKYGYFNNPFEVEAREVENKYNRHLLREMRETL